MLKKNMRKLIFLGAAATVLLFAADRTPQIHSYYLRKTAGSQVVLINVGRGGGTGFYVKGDSGNVYILTNSHVCNAADPTVEGKRVYIVKDDRAKDLCALASAKKSGRALSLRSSSPNPGEILNVLGHPKLEPKTLTSGEYVADKEVAVALPPKASNGNCATGETSIMTVFGFPICVKRQISSITTIQILPGNSGSPVVDYWGRLVGVMFGSSDGNRGVFTRHEDVKTFLEGL